ncbi:MAG TPA: M20/M25/M40 family metallo-hydrolase [Chitinophagaceae bacterium]|nr:M20/M25/M40 family metallo-hydrolase [Chitinophagaceae bacterium]
MRKIHFLPALFIFHFATAQNDYDASISTKIKQEVAQNSKVMDLAFYLTDVNGPRLTASQGYMNAANWASNTFKSWGLTNVKLEPWGDFGKGWEQQRTYIAMTKPYYQPLIAVPRAWTGSTPGNGVITSEVVLIKATDSAGLMQYAGKLKNKIVMTMVMDSLRPSFTPDARRWEDTTLDRMAQAVPRETGPRPQQQGTPQRPNAFATNQSFQRTLTKLLNDEKPALILSFNRSGNDGTIFVSGGGQYTKDAPEGPANLMLSSDDYLRLQRLVSAGIKTELEAEVKTKFNSSDIKGYNVIAEIEGSDPKLKNEIVMLGGHLDSWHGATGATDNAAGCAVMMEAARLLKTMNLKPKRTVRIVLWSGEEQGLFGSRNYVKNHLADPVNMKLLPEHSKVSAYYNLDNGGGKIRGIYAQGNTSVVPIFSKWLEPFKELGAQTVTINNTGSTDHVSFDAVGVPGFQFIQDPLEYNTRTHHTNMDTYDHLVPADLKQASAVVAAFVYNTAQSTDKLPRKELPQPRGETPRGF